MIQHVVVIRFVDGAPQEAIDRFADAVSQLPQKIPGVVDFSCGPDVSKMRSAEFAENWDFAVMASFHSLDDYKVYADHPAHHALKEQYLAGLLQDRAGVQLEYSV